MHKCSAMLVAAAQAYMQNVTAAISRCLLLRLAGTIPAAWGSNVSASFRLFSLANNMLTGNIPDSLASLAYSSSVFDISSNTLQGALGPNWYNVTSQSPARLSYFGTQ